MKLNNIFNGIFGLSLTSFISEFFFYILETLFQEIYLLLIYNLFQIGQKQCQML
jgi:hypothetical protein